MAILPQWAIGKHITNILLVPQSVSTADGTLGDTTPTRQFFGHLQDIDLDVSFATENLSSMDRAFENNVPIEQAATLRLTEFEANLASTGTVANNLAAACAFGATYWKYTLVRGANSFVGFGMLSSYKLNGTKPKVTAMIEFKAIDPSVAPLTYT